MSIGLLNQRGKKEQTFFKNPPLSLEKGNTQRGKLGGTSGAEKKGEKISVIYSHFMWSLGKRFFLNEAMRKATPCCSGPWLPKRNIAIERA